VDGGRVGVDLIKVLRAAFIHADSKSKKKTDSLSVFLRFWESAHVKAAYRMLMKLTLDRCIVIQPFHFQKGCRRHFVPKKKYFRTFLIYGPEFFYHAIIILIFCF